jgi:Reverse transcriptase (RNA-dependent DNA polymerase)
MSSPDRPVPHPLVRSDSTPHVARRSSSDFVAPSPIPPHRNLRPRPPIAQAAAQTPSPRTASAQALASLAGPSPRTATAQTLASLVGPSPAKISRSRSLPSLDRVPALPRFFASPGSVTADPPVDPATLPWYRACATGNVHADPHCSKMKATEEKPVQEVPVNSRTTFCARCRPEGVAFKGKALFSTTPSLNFANRRIFNEDECEGEGAGEFGPPPEQTIRKPADKSAPPLPSNAPMHAAANGPANNHAPEDAPEDAAMQAIRAFRRDHQLPGGVTKDRWEGVGKTMVESVAISKLVYGSVTKSVSDDVAGFFGTEILAPALLEAATGFFSTNLSLQFSVAPFFVFTTQGLYDFTRKRRDTEMLERIKQWKLMVPLVGTIKLAELARWVLDHQLAESSRSDRSVGMKMSEESDALPKSVVSAIISHTRYGKTSSAAAMLKNNFAAPGPEVRELYAAKFPLLPEDEEQWQYTDAEARAMAKAHDVRVLPAAISSALSDIRQPDGVGHDGLPPAILKQACKKKGTRDALDRFVQSMATSQIHPKLRGFFSSVKAIAHWKPNVTGALDVRPIGVPSTLIRVAGSSLMRSYRASVKEELEPYGLWGISCKNGVEKIVHTIRQAIETASTDPDLNQVIVLIDLTNAFNLVDRKAVLEVFEQRAPWIVPYYHSMYGQSQSAFFPGGTEDCAVRVETGCIQGEATGPLAVSLLMKVLWFDYVRSREMETLEDWDDKALMSILDDVTLISSAEEAADFLMYTATWGKRYGLYVSHVKTVAIAANSQSHTRFINHLSGAEVVWPLNANSIMVQSGIPGFATLGVPFNCSDPDYTRHFVKNKLAGPRALQILKRLEQIPDPQVKFRLMASTQGLAKGVFYGRTCPPGDVAGAFSVREDVMVAMLEDMLPAGAPPLDQLARLQIEQPFRHAGLGLPSVEKHKSVMYAASLQACRSMSNHPATFFVWNRPSVSLEELTLSSLKPVQLMLESTRGMFTEGEQKTILDWKFGGSAVLTQKSLSNVVYAHGRADMFGIISKMPDEEQKSIAHRLNSYSVAPNTAAYQSHLFSQNPFGHNIADEDSFCSILALRLGYPHGPLVLPCPRCTMPKCFEQSDALGEHATKCICGVADGFEWTRIESSTNARHNAAAKKMCDIASDAGVKWSREQSLESSENKDGDVVLDPLDTKGFMGPTFIDFSGRSCHTGAMRRLVDTHAPFWLRPTAGSGQPFLVTDEIEKEKHDSADVRVADANAHRSGHKITYVAFAFNHFGTIGREARPLISALTLRMKARSGKSGRAVTPYKEARILGFFSTAVQIASARSIRARVYNQASPAISA